MIKVGSRCGNKRTVKWENFQWTGRKKEGSKERERKAEIEGEVRKGGKEGRK